MTKELRRQFKHIGFVIENTGGGCQWLRKPLSNGLSLCVTDGEAQLPDLVAVIYLVLDANGAVIANSEAASVYQTLAILEQIE